MDVDQEQVSTTPKGPSKTQEEDLDSVNPLVTAHDRPRGDNEDVGLKDAD